LSIRQILDKKTIYEWTLDILSIYSSIILSIFLQTGTPLSMHSRGISETECSFLSKYLLKKQKIVLIFYVIYFTMQKYTSLHGPSLNG
jgi:hypothetical protein